MLAEAPVEIRALAASDSLRRGERGISEVPVANPGACVEGAEMRPFFYFCCGGSGGHISGFSLCRHSASRFLLYGVAVPQRSRKRLDILRQQSEVRPIFKPTSIQLRQLAYRS